MSLETCSSGHEEIVYNEEYARGTRSKCPLCVALAAMESLTSNLENIDTYVYGGGSAEHEVDQADEFYRQQIKDALP